MHSTIQLLDLVKEKHGGCSDYRAAQIMEINKSTVSTWRTGRNAASIENAKRLAEASGLSEEYVAICLMHEHAESKNHPNTMDVALGLEAMLKKYGKGATASFLAYLLPALQVADTASCILCKVGDGCPDAAQTSRLRRSRYRQPTDNVTPVTKRKAAH